MVERETQYNTDMFMSYSSHFGSVLEAADPLWSLSLGRSLLQPIKHGCICECCCCCEHVRRPWGENRHCLGHMDPEMRQQTSRSSGPVLCRNGSAISNAIVDRLALIFTKLHEHGSQGEPARPLCDRQDLSTVSSA
jgi:hypothetical protein